jgi:hypothetical protein
MNKPKSQDNTEAQAFLRNYFNASELCKELPRIDDIFSGALSLKTAGNTATRSLSRRTLFRIMQSCSVIDIDSVNKATGGRYAYRTLAEYSILSRVISKALTELIPLLPEQNRQDSDSQARRDLDAPYLVELERLGLV